MKVLVKALSALGQQQFHSLNAALLPSVLLTVQFIFCWLAGKCAGKTFLLVLCKAHRPIDGHLPLKARYKLGCLPVRAERATTDAMEWVRTQVRGRWEGNTVTKHFYFNAQNTLTSLGPPASIVLWMGGSYRHSDVPVCHWPLPGTGHMGTVLHDCAITSELEPL